MSEQSREESLLYPFRALDLTDEKGFLCGRILGDLGADVIKIEPPGGDPTRNIGPFYHDIPHPEKSLYWFAYNSNKRGITLNLKTIDGQEIFKKLVKTADFVIESFPPGYMDGLGLGYATLAEINARIIMTSITPFGQEGPYKDYRGSDIVMMAMGGLMHLTGDPDRPPVRISFPQAYLHTGASAAEGTMIAHYYREITGEGQWVDISAQECVNETPLIVIWHWDMNGDGFQRIGQFRSGVTMGQPLRMVWKCKDGHIGFTMLGGMYASVQKALTQWMDSEGMAPDFLREIDWDAFDFAKISLTEMDQITDSIAKFFLKHTAAELYEGAIKRRILLCPATTTADVLQDPQLSARGFWQEVEHHELGTTITYPGGFVKLSESPCRTWYRAPLIGEHNREIYEKELGFSEAEVVLLKQAGII